MKDYADEAGISSNNAGVRIFRAREALCDQGAIHGDHGEKHAGH